MAAIYRYANASKTRISTQKRTPDHMNEDPEWSYSDTLLNWYENTRSCCLIGLQATKPGQTIPRFDSQPYSGPVALSSSIHYTNAGLGASSGFGYGVVADVHSRATESGHRFPIDEQTSHPEISSIQRAEPAAKYDQNLIRDSTAMYKPILGFESALEIRTATNSQSSNPVPYAQQRNKRCIRCWTYRKKVRLSLSSISIHD